MRGYARLAADLVWVGVSPFWAIMLRENFQASGEKLDGIVPYALLCVLSAVVVFGVTRLHRTLWRYTSLLDLLHLIAAVTAVLLLALLGAFVINRLDGVARSLPVIQWFLLIVLMGGSRIAVRLLGERRGRRSRSVPDGSPKREHVMVVGISDLTELYLRSVDEFAPSFVVVGILTAEPALQKRSLRMRKILGDPRDVRQVLNQLELHGVSVTRIVVTQAFEVLSKETQDALRTVELESAIRVDWLLEDLGLRGNMAEGQEEPQAYLDNEAVGRTGTNPVESDYVLPGGYHRMKRVIDVAATVLISILLAPLFALTALLVAIDVGPPLVFWQQRPGRFGHSFKMFKFRTMRGAHDANGNRIPDALRSSGIGCFLRRTWLDEMPQLYNIVVGEMSFVGPRPLLPLDQPERYATRLSVRPGLTGWAQVNGGRDISPEDKAALDVWYIMNASFWLDIRILLRTLGIMVLGGGLNGSTPEHQRPDGTIVRAAAESDTTLLTDLASQSARGAQEGP